MLRLLSCPLVQGQHDAAGAIYRTRMASLSQQERKTMKWDGNDNGGANDVGHGAIGLLVIVLLAFGIAAPVKVICSIK